jgi:hypothetical protein
MRRSCLLFTGSEQAASITAVAESERNTLDRRIGTPRALV